MNEKEFQQRGNPTAKKIMLTLWGTAGALWGWALNSPATIKNGREFLMFAGITAICLAVMMTFVYWSTTVVQPPLDPDGRMPLPKEPRPEER